MRVQLDTIAVWDAIKSGGECFLCSLKKQAETRSVKFYLGPSVMNPETRVKVNQSWFCHDHVQQLLAAGKVQGMALMSDTYLHETRESLEKAMKGIFDAKAGRKVDKAVAAFQQAVEKRQPQCLVCRQVEEHDIRYTYTTAFLYGHDPDFQKALKEGKGFCLPHYQMLLVWSKEALDAENRKRFVTDLTEVELRNLERLQDDVLWQTQKFKAENFDKPWNGCEDAQKRVVGKLGGF